MTRSQTPVAGPLEVEHVDDVVVRQVRADLVLALEALERDVVLRDVVVQDLHRDARVGLLVDAFVDAPHAAVGDDAADLVAVAEPRPDARVVLVEVGDGTMLAEDERPCRPPGRTPRRWGTRAGTAGSSSTGEPSSLRPAPQAFLLRVTLGTPAGGTK
jgi:hypothetical protein